MSQTSQMLKVVYTQSATATFLILEDSTWKKVDSEWLSGVSHLIIEKVNNQKCTEVWYTCNNWLFRRPVGVITCNIDTFSFLKLCCERSYTHMYI